MMRVPPFLQVDKNRKSMKKVLIITGLLCCFRPAGAQTYETDAAQMMRNDLAGTARSLGAGGAFSTVGADMSSMSLNPAGIALYRSHEFAISGGGIWGQNHSAYLGQGSDASFQKGTISQAGFVFATRKLSRYDDLRYNRGGSHLDRFVIGFGYQKLADFNRTEYFYGTNYQNSYAQAMATDLNHNIGNIQQGVVPLPELNAYQTYIVDYTDSTNSQLASKIGLPVNQAGSVTSQGSLSELNLTLGFNVGNTVYIGAGMGIPYMSYNRYYYFNEGNLAGDSGYVNAYGYSYTGWGINGKFGIIVKPVQWLRFGAAVQSPTVYRLHEYDYGHANSVFGDTTAFFQGNNSFYNFTYNNPLKGTFGASFYFSHWGFFSVDYELDDYGHTHYTFDAPDNAAYWNNLISAKYQLSSTVRAGLEFAYKGLRLRGGFAWAQSPFKDNVAVNGYNGARFNYTAGIGYRGRSFFADLAYVRTMYKDYYAPYSYQSGSSTEEPGVYNNFTSNSIVATIGFKFGLRREN